MNELLGVCPVCSTETEVTRIECNNCHTSIQGNFSLDKFSKLNSDQKSFLDTFVKCRGNIKEVEKELGISYPTVKNRLENVAKALGHKYDQASLGERKTEILEKLNSGEISVDEAISLIKEK